MPARNTVFLSLALGYAEVVGAADLFIGVNAIDYSGYPDCRPEFIAAFEKLANLATKAGVEGTMQFRIHTPLIQMTKAEIIRRGTELGVDYSLTHSCYAPNDRRHRLRPLRRLPIATERLCRSGTDGSDCLSDNLDRRFTTEDTEDTEKNENAECHCSKIRISAFFSVLSVSSVVNIPMRIAEIYRSVQGEGLLTGMPSVFVRTSGCNLRCWFCDTPYTSWRPEGHDMSTDEIVAQVEEWDTRHVVVTGGEPMLFAELIPLCDAAARDRPAHHDRNGRHAVSAGRVRPDVDQPEVRQLRAVGRRRIRVGIGGTSASGIGRM